MTKSFQIVGSFDTETTNVRTEDGWSAFCCLYIMNDLRAVDLRTYECGASGEKIVFGRYESDFHDFIADMVDWGKENETIPVICAYNLMFDLQTVKYELNRNYIIKTTAQSSTNVYTVDLYENDMHVLRFWDTFHLEMNGLKAMGSTCGLEKLNGEWDYDLVRTPETPLTEEEKGYAARDVQVIPAYLRYLLEANEWLDPEMLGSTVLTKTSLVRQMAKREIGKEKYISSKGKRNSLLWAFQRTCSQEMPIGFYDHALRLACFRGGFTFTSAEFASVPLFNVASLDVVSMHHAFITGRYVPVGFSRKRTDILNAQAKSIVETSLPEVLRHYSKPFQCALHARIRFTNMRLQEDSPFKAWHIGLLAEGKFKGSPPKGFGVNERARIADESNRTSGWVDWARKPVFAFGKLMSGEEVIIHVSEIELWNVAQVYEWDEMDVILGESTIKFIKPPDYVTLQTCLLFERKSDAKDILKHLVSGVPYKRNIPDSIPDGIREQLLSGEVTEEFFNAWYSSTVKGQYNGIYGTQAQNVYKPDYTVHSGEWSIDGSSIVTHENWNDVKKDDSMVLYPYGLRIVGGSRMHLISAIMLLWDAFGNRIGITGGDTDSLKIRLGEVTTKDILQALEPLHDAIGKAINVTMKRARTQHPDLSSELEHLGEFELEDVNDEHYEAWNKARVSMKDGKVHVTCAGLSRPEDEFTIEDWIVSRAEEVGFFQAAQEAIGYNVQVAHEVSHSLQRTSPRANDMFDAKVTDHLGRTVHVKAHEAISLYKASRELGATEKRSNRENVDYLKRVLKRKVDTSLRIVTVKERKPIIERSHEIL